MKHSGGLDWGGGPGGSEEGTLEGEWTRDSGTQNKTWVLNFGVTYELVKRSNSPARPEALGVGAAIWLSTSLPGTAESQASLRRHRADD